MNHLYHLVLAIVSTAWTTIAFADKPNESFHVTIEIPKMNVSEYHRPYVAAWIQDENRKAVANLAVWYQMKDSKEGAGTKWLPDLRQWWRRSGRSLEMPVDGVSGASRPAGKHSLSFALNDPRLADIPSGKYILFIEAAREVGGREVLEIPFDWPITKDFSTKVAGEEELGEVSLKLHPAE